MRIGRLRHRVTIVDVVTAPGATGAPVETETELATVWAEVRTATASEQLAPPLEVVATTTQHRVTMRWRSDLRATMRLRWGERVLQVQAIIEPDNRQRLIQLECSEER